MTSRPAHSALKRMVRHALLGLSAMVLAGAWFASSANAADGTISATLTPAEVVLTPGASASGVLVLTNAGSTSTSVHVKAQPSDASITIRPVTTDILVPAGGSVSIGYTAGRPSEGTGQDVVVDFVVTYVQPGPGPSDAISHVTVAPLNVKAAAGLAVVDAKMVSNVGAINENRPGEASLVISNPRETAVRVDAIQVSAPTSVNVTLRCPTGQELTATGGTPADFDECTFTVGPRSSQVLHVTLRTTDTVAPGPRTAVFTITATSAGTHISASVVTNVEFTVEVFAESDILKALGVPIFLLLPGVIVVVVAWFLISKLSPWRRVTSGVSLEAWSATTTTAIVGLAVSLGIAAVYPALTRRFIPGLERDYLKAYGFHDFYYVFFYSFLIAIAAWIFAWLFSWLVYLYEWLFVPSVNDDARALLRKVCMRGVLRGSTAFNGASVSGKPGLNLGKGPGDKVLVAPAIAVTLVGDQGNLATTIDNLAASNRRQDAYLLWQTIRQAQKDGKIRIGWEPAGFGKPQVVDSSSVTDSAERPIVKVLPQE